MDAAEEKKSAQIPRVSLRFLIDKWGHTVQVVGAVAGVVVAVVAIMIQQDFARQQEQIEKEEARRAAIERSIALYNYFMNSEHIKELTKLHVNIHKHYSEEKEKTRESLIDSVIESVTDDNQVYEHLALLLNDIDPIAKCSKYEKSQWKNGRIEIQDETDDDQPLCDRETFRTLLLGPLSEFFFSYRYFFYCDKNLRNIYSTTMRKFEIMIADYTFHDYKIENPKDDYFVFLEDRDKERAVDDGLIESSHNYPILRLSPDDTYCRRFRDGFKEQQDDSMP